MPKLSRKQVAELITTKLSSPSIKMPDFIRLTQLFIQLTAPSDQQRYRERKKLEAITVKAAQAAVQEVAPKSEPEKITKFDDQIVQLEKERRAQANG